MKPDSPIATRYRASLGVRMGSAKPRVQPIRAVIIHTTGGGVARRARGEGDFRAWKAKHPEIKTTFEAAEWVYAVAYRFSGHYLVGQAGECLQLVPEDRVAQHVGSAKSAPYRLPGGLWQTGEYQWWADRWPGVSSPRELAGGKLWQGGVNADSIGIEVAPDIGDATGPWSDACWETLTALISDVSVRNEVPATREYVMSHSDAHPRARTAKGEPWDTPPAQWDWRTFADRAGAPF